MRTLRPHQVHAIDALRRSLMAGNRRPMLGLPTGAGKTITAATMITNALKKGKRVLFTVPAISLVDQTVREFYAEGIREIGVIQADHPMTDPTKPVQVASVQTLQRRHVPPADLVIIDEAHRNFQFVRDWMKKPEWRAVPFVGLSATPWSKGLGRDYDDLIVAATTADLIDAGYLSPFKVFAPTKPDLSKVRTVAGDYHEGDLSDAMQAGTITADVVTTWLQLGEHRPTLCFAVDCAHAQALQRQFQAAGVACGYQDAYSTPDEREAVKRAFEAGRTPVVCNVGTLTTGVDWDVRCIILARPTKSEILYCLDAETEILTSHGWRGMGQVQVGDCAATMANINTGQGAWSRISGVVEREMDSSENWVEYRAPRASFRVTDRHMMIAASMNEKGRALRMMPASELASIRGGAMMPTAVHMNQSGVPLTDAELYFVGMMMSDGSWTSTQGQITQSERHPAILERIEDTLRGCGIGYSKSRVPPPTTGIVERHRRWRFNFSVGKPKAHGNTGRGPVGTKRISEAVPGRTGFLHLTPYLDKDLSPALMAMSRRQLDTFLQGLWDGDGTKKLGVDYTPRSLEICSARPLLMDRLQALCAINGYTANVRKDHGPSRATPVYLITITPKDWRSCGGYSASDRADRPQIEMGPATDERVWCVETETGTIVTRRRGKVTVMGNCQIIGRGLRTAPGKADCIILDHSSTTETLGFVTDIRHEKLCDGKPKKPSSSEKKKPLPKECAVCHFLKPAKVHACPSCGFAPEKQDAVAVEDGELVEFTAARRAKANRESGWDEKAAFMADLRRYALDHGFREGWAAMKYKDRHGVWPNDPRVKYVEPSDGVSPVTASWIRSQHIRWAKSQKAKAA